MGPAVRDITLTSNMRFLKITYDDSSFVVVDRTASSPAQAILGHSAGHFERVTGLHWLSNRETKPAMG